MKIQFKIEGDNISFSSVYLPNAGITIENCIDIEKAKSAILNHVESKTGKKCMLEEVKEFTNPIFGINV